jgi:hypothetical protein
MGAAALACGCLGGCSGAAPGQGAWIPGGMTTIRITDATGLEPVAVRVNVTAPSEVRQIVGWINRMKAVPRGGVYSCPEIPPSEPTVSLAFRASAGGPVRARASETGDGSGATPCNPLWVSVPGPCPSRSPSCHGGGGQELLGGMFLERLQRLLKVHFGFGFGNIVGTLSSTGGRPLPAVVRARLPAGSSSGYNVYLGLDSHRFPHWGLGFVGFPVNRRGQFRSVALPGGVYLLDWGKGQGQPFNCPPTRVIVRVGHTTHARIPVDCPTK